ncbi:sorting nexin-5-like [Saccostrea echinata]|uniref:sorting nexin-5-like n=1 Tax=Saccostrea echinata TaxID=191078 RepID=UPI002A814819|nr:sorting nexin-5-like [Saccostrea echinata]
MKEPETDSIQEVSSSVSSDLTQTKEHDYNGISEDSGLSSSPTHGPFQPLYSVKVPNAVKNGEALQFTICVSKLGSEESEEVVREYEDLEWLQHCLMTEDGVVGCIIPPLPAKPEYDAKAAESKTKKQLGSDANIIMADEFHKDCRNVERYLKMVISHEKFGKSELLKNFLCEKEAAVRTKLKKSLFMRVSQAVDEARKGQHKDVDEYFQTQRDWATKYAACIKESSLNFNKMLFAQMRLANCYGHLTTVLKETIPFTDDSQKEMNRYQLILGEGAENVKHGLEVMSRNDEKSLGVHLDLYAKYMESVKEMLFRRTCLLVTYEDANKSLEKAKPNKRTAAEEVKLTTEKSFEECSDTARRELKSFRQQRLLAFGEALSTFVEAQIKTSRDSITLLLRTLKSIKCPDDSKATTE